MSGGTSGPLNLDELMAKVRAEVSARGAAAGAPPPTGASPAAPARKKLLDLLATAARYAPLSSLAPELVGWGRLKRGVAMPVARVVMYLSRFITNKQALFNQAVLEALHELTRWVAANAAEGPEALRDELRRLAAEVRDLQERAPGAGTGEAAASAPALAARLESLAARLAAVEEHLASPPAREVVTPIGRRTRSEP